MEDHESDVFREEREEIDDIVTSQVFIKFWNKKIIFICID
jgi:hypothetical protein